MQPGERAPWLAVITLAFLVGACSATPATPTPGLTESAAPTVSQSSPTFSNLTPTTSPSEIPTPSPSPTAIPSPSPTAIPSVSPTVAPSGVTEPLLIKWVNPPGASGLDGLIDLRGYARSGNRYVIVGSMEVLDPAPNPDNETHDEAAIWWSDNATTWHQAALPETYMNETSFVLGVTAGGPGFVAVGNGIPLWSADGIVWAQGSAAAVNNVTFAAVGAADDGIVAEGIDFDASVDVVITSPDGKTWIKSSTAAALVANSQVHFAQGDHLAAFASQSTDKTVVYQVGGVSTWTKLGTIHDAVDVAAQGPLGWLAIGRYAWLSTDGQTWTRAPMTPIVPLGSAQAIIEDSAGYVVSTNVYPPGCAIEESQIVGYTWTSVDGLTWHKMNASFQGRWLNAFFILDRTLVGVGQSHDGTEPIAFGFVRTADLPAVPPLAEAAPTPVPTPTPPQGCGP